jgi:hypothetical protein
MMAWEQMKRGFGRVYDVALAGDRQLTVRAKGTRVRIEHLEADARRQLIVRVDVCREQELGAREALVHNGRSPSGTIGLEDGLYVLRDRLHLDHTDERGVLDAIEDLIARARGLCAAARRTLEGRLDLCAVYAE